MAIKGLPVVNSSTVPDRTSAIVATPQRILFVGQKTSGGTATAGELITGIGNDNSWDTLFGAKSMLAGMVRAARQVTTLAEKQITIDAIALDDATGTNAAGTITFVGTATAAGTLKVIVGSSADYTYTVPVAKDDTETDIADALVALITADTKVPVTSANVAGVVTNTYTHDGTVGDGVTQKITGTVAGITHSVTAGFTGGATDPTLTSVLDVVGTLREQALVYPAEYGYDFGTDFMDPRFNFNNKILNGLVILSQTDTLANHKTNIALENSPSLLIECNKTISATSWKGSVITELDYIIAAQVAAERAVRVESGSGLTQFVIGQFDTDIIGGVYNNSLPMFNTAMPLMDVIDSTRYWTKTEINEINTAGGSVLDNNQAPNGVVFGEQYTTYKTDIAGNPDSSFKFVNYRDTIKAVEEYRFNNFKRDFAQYRLDDSAEQEVRNAFVRYYRTLSGPAYRLLRSGKASFDFYNATLTVAVDFENGLVTVISRDPIQTQLRQLNAIFKVTFDITTGVPVSSEEAEAEAA